ncbi:MAG: glutamine--tRNA ligase/YqeY domain fusion protein [Planctomycetes bacterium]|nr:glutamine--tRNA ligase/YqeY domain fusion protein [Planctomycetota bacterium]
MTTPSTPEASPPAPVLPRHFIHDEIDADLAAGKNEGRVQTRFPPEPNGYLHIGHAKSICLNFGLAQRYGGKCNLRFDDTNPTKEEQEYVDSIQEDVRWLGFTWDRLTYASDFFEELYHFAEHLITNGKAYICDLSGDEVSEYRGSLDKPGRESPFRHRTPAESLDLFRRMRAGEFKDGARTLRAKIDMSSPNPNLRDPVLYRILHAHHHRTRERWCIYPMYDFAHGQCDALESITHSICTLEFEIHRPLYNWFLENLPVKAHPRQIEFARLNLSYTVLSKRKLLELVRDKHVSGWDDPRMPTLSGIRRRGYTPESLRAFCDGIGVARNNGTIDRAVLENSIREDLNKRALRAMAVLDPLKITIENFPEGQIEWIEAVNNPEDPAAGTRKIPFTRTLWIEREDFKEDPPKKYFRLSPGKEVRLRYAWCITCKEVKKDASGNVTELVCTYDPATLHGATTDGRKVKGIIHWVSAEHAFEAPVRLYDHLFSSEHPDDVPEGVDWKSGLNPGSLVVAPHPKLEPSLQHAEGGQHFQFERVGYFFVDPKDSRTGAPVFHRTTTLRDAWARIEKRAEG